jgi:copper oxidase (laccase) domain-containing protein
VGACCDEVGVDVLEAFRRGGVDAARLPRWFFAAPQPTDMNRSMRSLSHVPRANHWFFDGWAATRHQLDEAGVPAHQIHVAELCTASHPEILCSYRRDGMATGRIAGAIRSI